MNRPITTLIALAALMSGCSRVTHHFNTLSIDFEYQGRAYHETWVNECTTEDPSPFLASLFKKPQSSSSETPRWREVAKRLPDGSGVVFKMKRRICDHDGAEMISFGAGAVNDHPDDLVLPSVYWFDSAEKPTRVEACIYKECSLSPTARIRIISIRSGPSNAWLASNPFSEVAALATAKPQVNALGYKPPSDRAYFVGYACWAIPLDGLAESGDEGGDSEFESAGALSHYRGGSFEFGLSERHLFLLNRWAGEIFGGGGGLTDMETGDHAVIDQINRPRIEWSQECQRSGDVVQFSDNPHESNVPIVMFPITLRTGAPTQFYISGEGDIDVGGKDPPDLFSFNELNDGLFFSAATVVNKHTFYIAEAHVLTF